MSFRSASVLPPLLLLLLLSLVAPIRAWVVVPVQKHSVLPVGSGGTQLAASLSTPGGGSSRGGSDASYQSSSSSRGGGTTKPQAAATKVVAAKPTTHSVDFDWPAVAKAAFEEDQRPILLFDGVCNFCNAGVNLCLDWDSEDRFRFASLQSKTGQALLIKHGRAPDDFSSMVLVMPDDKAYFESDAVLRIGQELHGLPSAVRGVAGAVRAVLPKWTRNAAYRVVSKNRHWFGETDQCRLDFDGTIAARFVSDPILKEDQAKEEGDQ